MIRKLILPSLLALALPAGAAYMPATVETTGESVTMTTLLDQSRVVKFLADGTFTVPDGATARLLLVGGGGAGGYDAAGGGGAGGMLESNAVVLAAGTYTVSVGAGGTPVANVALPGGSGGDTVLSFGGAEVAKALGGGGGGAWGKSGSWSAKNGVAGGSGGGCAGGGTGTNGGSGAAGAGTPEQGHDGAGGGYFAGGGGGAGEAGHPGLGRGYAPGDGGKGRPSDITGEEVWYAGGGGGGGWADTGNGLAGGRGGRGGGGNGARNVSNALRQNMYLDDGRTEYEGEAGVDGLGGGGGGGGNTKDNMQGRPGGSGVLVVRLCPVVSGDAAEPALGLVAAEDGPASATIRALLVTAGDGASSADVSYAVATSAAALDSATPVPVASGVAAGETVSAVVPGLTAGTTYYVRLVAENNLGKTGQLADATVRPYAAESAVTAVGAARVFDVGRDRVAVFTNSTATQTFTLPERTAVELLLVGGGGAGGGYIGGGGGAGGFLHVESVVLDAGTYTVAVGAGGQPNSTTDQRPGGSGGNTTLSSGGSTIYTAHGGGGGGGYNSTSPNRHGLPGGSGGGAGIAAGYAGTTTAADGERGHPGAANDVPHNTWSLASGGGGAGSSGTRADYANIVGGAGGDGLPCSITGEEIWYAGGGGAGQNDQSQGGYVFPAGRGGRGGGGMGCRTADSTLDDYECGTDGLGGGGGGGRREGTNAAGSSRRGAPGGSGTLIVRWKAVADTSARTTVDSVVGSVGGAVVSGSVEFPAAGAAGADIQIAVGPAGGALGSWETIGTGLQDGERFTLALAGLASGTDYDYAVRVVSGGTAGEILGAATGSFSTLFTTPARISGTPSGATKTTVGTDSVYSFSTPGTYTFTITTRGRARFLMVGGGGAGGSRRGGGGGAGGFIELPATTLEPGEYTVVVGAGGTPSTAPGVGGDGGDSTLSLAGTLLYTAHGGGGGGYGNKDAGTVNSCGRAGGSGGGGGPPSTSGGASTAISPELGNPGGAGSGKAADKFDSAAAGGGGAGGPGASGYWSDIASGPNRRQGGNGGAGVASDITGAELWYAGGGGGSVWYDGNGGYKGLGGSGVGGDGGGYTTEVNQGAVAPTPGADGTGSGGGGGRNWNSNNSNAEMMGAAGGCGAFILRLGSETGAEIPEVVLETLEAGVTSADAVVALVDSGSQATADLSLLYGTAPDTLDLSASVAAGASPGLYTATVSGLAGGKTWYFAPVASNAGGAATGSVLSVTLPAAGALPAGDGSYGLWQISRRTTAAAFPDVFTNDQLWAQAQVSNVVAGALAADTDGYLFEDPATGLTYVWPGVPSLYAYRGWIYLHGGKTVVFGTRYADSAFVAIDGRPIVTVVKSFMTDAFGSIETDEAGWHEIEIRVGHTTENFGPDGDGNGSWADMGVAFNENGSTSPEPESGWTRILDPGDGSLLRPSRPAARTLSLTNAVASGGTLSLGAVVGSGANAAHACLVYGNDDAGTASVSAWEHSTDLGEVAAANAATDLAAQVAGWGSAAKVARLVLETEGLLSWTEPVAFTDTALPQVGDVTVSDYASGDSATFRTTVSGGTAPYTAKLLVGPDADSLSVAATASVAAAGEVVFDVTGLEPGAKQWFLVEVADASGATGRSEILSFVTPGASRVYEFADANTEALWNDGNPFVNQQRTILAGGTVSELGAGETTVRFLRTQTSYAFPAKNSTQPHEGEQMVVDSLGSYVLPVLLDWDWDVTWNWSVSNSNGTASWGPTAAARDYSTAYGRNTTVVDATAYTWAGGEGLWNDTNQWTPDGVWDDIAGYPRRGSYAVFPANATAVVSVPDTALTNRFSQLTLGTGADVTFHAADGATGATLMLQGEANVSSARGYAVNLAKNSKLAFTGENLYVELYGSAAIAAADTGTSVVFADGVRATIGNNTGGGGWTANAKQDSSFAVTNGAYVTVRGYLIVNGITSQMVLDDATIVQPYAANDNNGVHLRGRNMNGKASLVIRGANPVLQAGYRFRVTDSDTADKTQYIDFEVPEGGWADAPIRTSPSNAIKFGANGKANYKIVLRVPATAPAVVAGESLDVPLVRWPKGIDTTYVTLDSQYLPHPGTDGFFQTTDPVTGQITVWAHLVGQADTTAPQASDFRVRALAQTGADLSFVVVPGSGGATAVGVEVLDANGGAVAGATVSPASATFSASGTNLVTVAGLDPATDYLLHVTLDDGSNPVATTNFAFNSLDDWAEGRSATADSVVQDGPYTVWTFTDTAQNAATFTVTRAGLAEILVVGGGGSGGGGVNADNDAGGGGGGGGQVVSTTRALVPGIYAVSVGAGGAKGTARAIGVNGKTSAFGDILAVGGGGGGYSTTVPLSGASGGGGANGKAGAAATAGFPGGAGVSKAGGGGGGGATAAGSAGVSKTGGAGGAGFTSSISGYPAVYGAGGGGGGSGTYGSGQNVGGAAGGDTAGVGGSRNVEFQKTAVAAAMHGKPGYGGGGGGGCGSNSGSDTASGAAYGAAGGSGTVIVRMRTQTAAVPAPQAAIKAEESGEADWTASLVVYSLGQGADHVDFTLRVARDGSATTNDFAMGTVSATGAVVRAATGLAPASDYEGVLLLDNGLADGTLEIPVAFRTADPVATTVSAGARWDYGAWTGTAADFHENVLSNRLPVVTVASTGADGTPSNLARATNGRDDDLRLAIDRLYTWTWNDPVYLTSFRIFFRNNGTQGAVNVASVEVLGEDGTWTVISPGPGHYYDSANGGLNRGYLLPADGATALWDEPAYGIRFTSDGNITGSEHYLREVEAEGVLVANQPADLSIASLSRTGAGIKALVAFSHELPADATVTALVAPTHGGTDLASWNAATSVVAQVGALSQNVAIDADDLEGMNYLRFRSDDGNGGVRWSETVYLPDVEILSAIPPVVHFVAQRAATPSTATLAASLVDAGSGAVNDQADLYVRYAAVSNGVAAASPVLVASGAGEGETTATLSGLMPARVYWGQLVAVNAEGGSGGTGASELFTFGTAADEVGGGAVSAVNGWYCDAWSTATAETADNLLRGVIGTETTGGRASLGSVSNLTDGIITESKYWAPAAGTSVEFELGGAFSLTEFRIYQYSTDTARRTISIASLEWRDEAGEWHRIPGSPLEFDVANNNCAFLTPADGSPYLAVGATAFRFTQGDGGSPDTHYIREMELFGEPSGGYRALTVDAAAWSGGTLSATVSRPVTNAVGTIYAVSGAAYHGTNETAWAADGGAAVSLGALAADQTAVSGTFTPAAGAVYVRFYEEDANGNVVAWSDTIPADDAAVRVVDGGVQADGDVATFPIRVVSAGTGTLSVKVLLADDPDFTNATEIAVANPAVGDFTVTADVDPGATYWYRIVAETTDGGFDETPAATFTTLAGSVLASTVSVNTYLTRYAILRGTLETLGAGVTTLEILTGDSSGSLSVYDTMVLDSPGAFAYPGLFTGRPRTIYFRFHTVNVSPGGETWESWSSTGSFTTSDSVTYTWKKEVTEGAWNDPANWTPSVFYACTGYPDYSGAGVDFPNGTVATITVPGKYRFGNWSVLRNDIDLTFVGNGADVSGFGGNNDNMGGGTMKNCSWTFSALSLTEKDGIYFGDPNSPSASYNSTLRFTDGAVVSFGNAITAAGSNMWIVVDGGATLVFRTYGPALEVKDGGIVVDGGTIDAARILTDYGWNQTTNQAILVSGAAPRIVLSEGFRNSTTDEEKYWQNADTDFLFSVPGDGWADPVIYSETEDQMFAGLTGSGAGKYTIAIDPASPIFQTGRTRTVTLVAWKGGIDTDHVRLVDPPKGATIFYTYGWPSVLTEPANAGDAPTGVCATLRGYAGTLLLIK